MRDDSYALSPDRGRDDDRNRDSRRYRSRDSQHRPDDYNQSRQDNSQSPSRDDMHDNAWDQRSHRSRPPPQNSFGADRGRAENYREAQETRPRQSHSPHSWSRDNQGRMYNDDYHHDRHEQGRTDGYPSHRSGRGSYSPRSTRLGYPSRSRSRSPTRDGGRSRDAGHPSDTVIFESLPARVDVAELRESIISCISVDFPLVDVRMTFSRGQRRAFIQFEEVDHAATFINDNFPQVLITLPNSTDEVPDGRINAYIHFARPREEADVRSTTGLQWICQSCGFDNYASRAKCKRCNALPSSTSLRQSLNAAADAADAPTQILVVYPLTAFINEDMLATDMKRLELEKPDPANEKTASGSTLKSTAPADRAARTGARPGSLHRVFLMRDPKTDESVKYGFAEFWTLQDAVAAMDKIKLLPSFTVAGCAVTVSHIHLGVFIPEERQVTPNTERFSFTPLFNTALRVRYRDLRAYPSQKVITAEPPANDEANAKPKRDEEGDDGKKQKKRKAADPLAASVKRPAPAMMSGHIAMWQRKHEEIHTDASGDKESSAVTKPPSSKPSKAPPIKFSLTGATMQPAPPPPPSSSPPAPPAREDPNDDDTLTSKVDEQTGDQKPIMSYAARDRLMCLLCMRKFKSLDELDLHEKQRMHTEKLGDEQAVKEAVRRLAKIGVQPQPQTEGSGDVNSTASQYRDRAKERREQFKQPKKPPPPPQGDKGTAAPPKDQAKAPASSKGAGMLAKMGWKTGSGLGSSSEGRTDTIATNVYQQGVGLGAEGANLGNAAVLGERRTLNSYKEYVHTVQDRARERFNDLRNEGGQDEGQVQQDEKEEKSAEVKWVRGGQE